jgi:hypothetical protein
MLRRRISQAKQLSFAFNCSRVIAVSRGPPSSLLASGVTSGPGLSSPAEIGILQGCRPGGQTLDRRYRHRRSWRKTRCCYAIEAITKRGFDLASQSWINRLSTPLIAFALAVGMSVSTVHAVGDARKVSVVSFGLFGDQGVFRREASAVAQVVADRFGNGPINVQYNSKKGGAATIETLAMSLQAAANGMDAENDVLFLILTSHGSRAGLTVKAGRLTQTLTPSNLADMLARTGVRHKVVVISACYSGVFIPRLANPDTLVITAADPDHPSFGCRDKAKWTYFGDAFFNVALRQAKSLKDAFAVARALVQKRELREHFEPSNPLMAGGTNVRPLLFARDPKRTGIRDGLRGTDRHSSATHFHQPEAM